MSQRISTTKVKEEKKKAKIIERKSYRKYIKLWVTIAAAAVVNDITP